jgi:hypothetical protein
MKFQIFDPNIQVHFNCFNDLNFQNDIYKLIFKCPTMNKLQLTGQTWAKFSTLDLVICMLSIFGVIKQNGLT